MDIRKIPLSQIAVDLLINGSSVSSEEHENYLVCNIISEGDKLSRVVVKDTASDTIWSIETGQDRFAIDGFEAAEVEYRVEGKLSRRVVVRKSGDDFELVFVSYNDYAANQNIVAVSRDDLPQKLVELGFQQALKDSVMQLVYGSTAERVFDALKLLEQKEIFVG